MKRRTLLLLGVSLLFFAQPALAAKLYVTWKAPVTNNDGSPLTDLASFYIQWGTCTASMTVKVTQGGISAAASATSSPVYPTGLNPVCIQIFAVNSKGAMSDPAYASYSLTPPTLSQPIH